MKNLILLMMLSSAVLIFAGCGDTAEVNNTSNATGNSTTAANKPVNKTGGDANAKPTAADAAPEMSEEEMEKAMTEDITGIDTANPMPAGELYNVFTANESAGKGQKLAVKGTYTAHATSSSVIDTKKPAYRFELKGEKGGVACVVKDRPKETDEISNAGGGKDKIMTVKGVARTTVDGISGMKMVALEPCEIVKLEIK